MQFPGIYSIRFGLDERIYIGSSMNCARRKSQHLYKLRRNSHENPKLQNYYNKYGEELFSFCIIEKLDQVCIEKIRIKEQEYLNKYYAQEYINSKYSDRRFDDLLLNVTPEVGLMVVHWSDKRKKALIARNKSFVWTNELKQKMSDAKKGKKIPKEAEKRRQVSCELHREKIRKERSIECPKCSSIKTSKTGVRENKTKGILMQRMRCLDCKKQFSIQK